MDAEDFVEFGTRLVHTRQIEAVDDNGQRKLPKIVPRKLDLLDRFAEFPDPGFLRIVQENVQREPRR